VLPTEQLNLLDAFAAQLALSLQRARLAEDAEAARISAERALLRNTLLASISHDLRTPLSAIAGAGSLIAQPEYALNADRRTTLGNLIERKARDMSQLLTNVLELMQMEFGNATLRTDWHAVDDLVALALRTNQARLAQWRTVVSLPTDLPLILVEATLIVQILSNLLENAAKYTPPGTTITLSAAVAEKNILLTVADDGPGLPPGDPERLFEKFQRGRSESNIVGVGLGLAICRAAARASKSRCPWRLRPMQPPKTKTVSATRGAEGNEHDRGDAPHPHLRGRSGDSERSAHAVRGKRLPGRHRRYRCSRRERRPAAQT
jgi:two-component system sensor histidine kinase KdpD